MDKQITAAVAIANRSILTLTYQGQVRIVEPHATGKSPAGTCLLRAYQTAPETGWQLFDLNEIQDVNIMSVKFEPRLDPVFADVFEKITAQV